MRTYPTWINKRFESSSSCLDKPFNNRNLNYWGKGRNGVSRPLVLSMRPYAHILWKHAKIGHFISMKIYFKNLYTNYTRPYQINNTYSLSHRKSICGICWWRCPLTAFATFCKGPPQGPLVGPWGVVPWRFNYELTLICVRHP